MISRLLSRGRVRLVRTAPVALVVFLSLALSGIEAARATSPTSGVPSSTVRAAQAPGDGSGDATGPVMRRARGLRAEPARPLPRERTVFSGKAPVGARPAVLQRKKGHRWVQVARGRIRANGSYRFAIRPAVAGRYRVHARQHTSRAVRVRLARQRARMSVPPLFVKGLDRRVTAVVTPVRKRRVVRLQRHNGTRWVTVASARSNGRGRARITYAGGPLGATKYRVLGAAFHGSRTVASGATRVRTARATELLSAGAAEDAGSFDVDLSADGRWVAFASNATLLPTDTDDHNDVYLFDRVTGTLTQLLVEANMHVSAPHLSATGRYVAFQSNASNLFGESEFDYDVGILDRSTGVVELVSDSAEVPGPADDDSYLYGLSDDGSTVAFASTATDLVAFNGPPNHVHRHAYIRKAGVTRALDRIGLGWAEANVYGLDLSADGSRVVFQSSDADLDPGHVDGRAVFGWDIAPGDGALSNRTNLTPDVDADSPSVSGDGSLITFTSDASLVPGDVNGMRDTYLRVGPGSYLLAGPVAAIGSPGGEVSDDGRLVVLATKTEMPGDTNGGFADVVLWERATGTNTLLTRGGPGASQQPVISRDNSVVALNSSAVLAPGSVGILNTFAMTLK